MCVCKCVFSAYSKHHTNILWRSEKGLNFLNELFLLFLHIDIFHVRKQYASISNGGYRPRLIYSIPTARMVNVVVAHLVCTPSFPVCCFFFSFLFYFFHFFPFVSLKHGNRILYQEVCVCVCARKCSGYCCRMLFIYGFKLFSMARLY